MERDSNGRKAGKGPLVQTELSATIGVSQDQTLIEIGGGATCIGNGQGDIATHITHEMSQTLNAMHDAMAVMYRKDDDG